MQYTFFVMLNIIGFTERANGKSNGPIGRNSTIVRARYIEYPTHISQIMHHSIVKKYTDALAT